MPTTRRAVFMNGTPMVGRTRIYTLVSLQETLHRRARASRREALYRKRARTFQAEVALHPHGIVIDVTESNYTGGVGPFQS